MKKQKLQITANNQAIMMWVVSTVQNDERHAYGVYTDMDDAWKALGLLEKQGFEVSFLETCLEFGKQKD